MNEQIDNSSPLSLSQALELIKTREGENFSNEKVNLAELQRLTGITRGKLRRLKKNSFQRNPDRAIRWTGDLLMSLQRTEK